jgi:hypothetical protein
MRALAVDRRFRREMTTPAELHRESVDELAFFRGLLLALVLGALSWIALAALALGIYKLAR